MTIIADQTTRSVFRALLGKQKEKQRLKEIRKQFNIRRKKYIAALPPLTPELEEELAKRIENYIDQEIDTARRKGKYMINTLDYRQINLFTGDCAIRATHEYDVKHDVVMYKGTYVPDNSTMSPIVARYYRNMGYTVKVRKKIDLLNGFVPYLVIKWKNRLSN